MRERERKDKKERMNRERIENEEEKGSIKEEEITRR